MKAASPKFDPVRYPLMGGAPRKHARVPVEIEPGSPTAMVHELARRLGSASEVGQRLGVSAAQVVAWLRGGQWVQGRFLRHAPGGRYTGRIRALYSELIRPVPQEVDWAAAMRELIEHRGGLRPAAREVGMAPTAAHMIATGRQRPHQNTQAKITRAIERVRSEGAATNPRAQAELAWLTNPDRPRRHKRDAKWKPVPEHHDVEAGEFNAHPDWTQAQKLSRRFHGKEADQARVYEIDDGRSEVTVDPNLYVALHETLEVPYVVPWESDKRGNDPSQPIVWFHEFPAGSRPMKLLNVRTGITSDEGGSYVVDDYWYS
jgi:hypothetical protein